MSIFQHNLAENKLVTVKTFRSERFIDVRKLFKDEDDGCWKPTKSGVTLRVEEYRKFQKLNPTIDRELDILLADCDGDPPSDIFMESDGASTSTDTTSQPKRGGTDPPIKKSKKSQK